MSEVCCGCGEQLEHGWYGPAYLCKICLEWGISRQDIFPTIEDTFREQFHRLGKDGGRYWGKMGAGILYTNGKEILLLKRKAPSDHPGTWGIPGGRAKEREAPIDTAMRETREECGATGQGQQFARFDEKDGTHRFHVFLYSVKKPFDCRVSDEHSEYRWIPLQELKKYDLHPKMKASWPHYERAIKKRFGSVETFSTWLDSKKT